MRRAYLCPTILIGPDPIADPAFHRCAQALFPASDRSTRGSATTRDQIRLMMLGALLAGSSCSLSSMRAAISAFDQPDRAPASRGIGHDLSALLHEVRSELTARYVVDSNRRLANIARTCLGPLLRQHHPLPLVPPPVRHVAQCLARSKQDQRGVCPRPCPGPEPWVPVHAPATIGPAGAERHRFFSFRHLQLGRPPEGVARVVEFRAVSETVVPLWGTVGSNTTPSATLRRASRHTPTPQRVQPAPSGSAIRDEERRVDGARAWRRACRAGIGAFREGSSHPARG